MLGPGFGLSFENLPLASSPTLAQVQRLQATSDAAEAPLAQKESSPKEELPIDDVLVVRSKEPEYRIEVGVYIFRGGVEAEYDVTKLKSDTLILRVPTGDPEVDSKPIDLPEYGVFGLVPEEGYAMGGVRIDDPDGKISAAKLRFKWQEKDRTAMAEGIQVEIGAMQLKAARAEIKPSGWTLWDVDATTCREKVPFYRVRVPVFRIYPGQRAVMEKPRLSLLGADLPVIPKLSFSLDRRTQGLTLPTIANRANEGLGLSWNSDIEVNKDFQLYALVNSYERIKPQSIILLTNNRIPNADSDARVTPRLDINERFSWGYFRNVYIRTPEQEHRAMRQLRDTWSAGAMQNIGSYGRLTDFGPVYSKEWEFVREQSGPLGDGSFYLQARTMSFAENNEAFRRRTVLNASIGSPLLKSGNLTGIARLDVGSIIGQQTFSFIGAEGGLVYKPLSFWGIGVGAYGYELSGRPEYRVDEFPSRQGLVVRTDLLGSSTKLSFLWRYDPNQGWFAREFRISQVMGCLEPVLVYRSFPQDYQFGFTFRFDKFLDILQRRKFDREKRVNSDGRKP